MGDAPRSVEYWVHDFEERCLAGLVEGARRGRPQRLDEPQLQEVKAVLRHTPREVGLIGTLWDGKTLQVGIQRHCRVQLGVRQRQRMLRQFGFGLRKPRPLIAHSDAELEKTH